MFAPAPTWKAAWMTALAVERAGTSKAGALHGPPNGPRRIGGARDATGPERSTCGWQTPSAAMRGALQATDEAFLTTAVTSTTSPGRYRGRSVTTDIPT